MDQRVPAVLVISHGPVCQALIDSVKMIFGDAQRLEALPLGEGMDPDAYEAALRALVEKYEGNVFLCVDIMGGTPFKCLAKLAKTRRLSAVAGISVPMLIEVLSNREECAGDELATRVAENCAGMEVDLTAFMKKVYHM